MYIINGSIDDPQLKKEKKISFSRLAKIILDIRNLLS